MVPSDSPVILRQSNSLTENRQNVDPTICQRTCSPTPEIVTTSHMDCMWRQYQGFSAKSAEIPSNACRTKTTKQYQSSRKLWLGSRNLDPFSVSAIDIIEFLSNEFQKNKSYSALNSYCSMLSGTVSPIDGFAVGKHPTVIQFLKGVYNLNPTKPKYCTVWYVSVVLKYIKSLPCNDNLLLKDLTYKHVILVALVSADRGQSIALLDLKLMSLPSKAVFVIGKLTKTSKPDKPVKKIVLPAYPKCEKLCIKSTFTSIYRKY